MLKLISKEVAVTIAAVAKPVTNTRSPGPAAAFTEAAVVGVEPGVTDSR